MDGDVHRPVFLVGSQLISGAQFFGLASSVAKTLPDRAYAINFCENRFWFAVSFFAALLRGQTNVLLPGHQPGMLLGAQRLFPDAYLCAENEPAQNPFSYVASGPLPEHLPELQTIPVVPADQAAMVIYTSGTTGTAQPLVKSVACIVEGARINARVYSQHVGMDSDGLIATVPPWHMYGFEWSVMLPLFARAPSYCGATLFPDDIDVAIATLGQSSSLITTPHHLSAIVRTKAATNRLCNVLTATAPLSTALANAVTERISGSFLEIYGCSEAGSVAARLPAQCNGFEFFPGFSAQTEATVTTLKADHIVGSVELADILEFDHSGDFQILGRSSDLIKVAGKRASLAALNAQLLAIDYVQDGSFYHSGNDDERLALVVVCDPLKKYSEKALRDALSRHIEPAFMPRRIRFVDALPRNPTGKLIRKELVRIVNATDSGLFVQ